MTQQEQSDRDILLLALLRGESPDRYPESLARFVADIGHECDHCEQRRIEKAQQLEDAE